MKSLKSLLASLAILSVMVFSASGAYALMEEQPVNTVDNPDGGLGGGGGGGSTTGGCGISYKCDANGNPITTDPNCGVAYKCDANGNPIKTDPNCGVAYKCDINGNPIEDTGDTGGGTIPTPSTDSDNPFDKDSIMTDIKPNMQPMVDDVNNTLKTMNPETLNKQMNMAPAVTGSVTNPEARIKEMTGMSMQELQNAQLEKLKQTQPQLFDANGKVIPEQAKQFQEYSRLKIKEHYSEPTPVYGEVDQTSPFIPKGDPTELTSEQSCISYYSTGYPNARLNMQALCGGCGTTRKCYKGSPDEGETGGEFHIEPPMTTQPVEPTVGIGGGGGGGDEPLTPVFAPEQQQ